MTDHDTEPSEPLTPRDRTSGSQGPDQSTTEAWTTTMPVRWATGSVAATPATPLAASAAPAVDGDRPAGGRSMVGIAGVILLSATLAAGGTAARS